MVKDILKGLVYLHKNEFIHTNIKANNVLLNEAGYCKLTDCCVSTNMIQTMIPRNGIIISPYWTAPEVFTSNGYKFTHNSKVSQYYSYKNKCKHINLLDYLFGFIVKFKKYHFNSKLIIK